MDRKQDDLEFVKADRLARAGQLEILRDCVIPDRLGVSSPLLKLILKLIDDYSRGKSDAWVSQETLATLVSRRRETVQRAMKVLSEKLSVLTVVRKKNRAGVSSNHYRIVWSELALLCQQGPNPVTQIDQFDVPPTGRSQGTNATFLTDQCDIADVPMRHYERTNVTCMSRKAPEAQLNASSSTLSDEGEVEEERDFETWEQAEQQLRAQGLATATQIAHDARSCGLTASEVLQAIRDYEANRSHFRGPGAITFRLRTGAWPTNVIIKPAVDRELERSMKLSIESYVEKWRAAHISEKTIAERLYNALQDKDLTARGLSRELLVRMGWADPATTLSPASGPSVST